MFKLNVFILNELIILAQFVKGIINTSLFKY